MCVRGARGCTCVPSCFYEFCAYVELFSLNARKRWLPFSQERFLLYIQREGEGVHLTLYTVLPGVYNSPRRTEVQSPKRPNGNDTYMTRVQCAKKRERMIKSSLLLSSLASLYFNDNKDTFALYAIVRFSARRSLHFCQTLFGRLYWIIHISIADFDIFICFHVRNILRTLFYLFSRNPLHKYCWRAAEIHFKQEKWQIVCSYDIAV